MSPARCGLQQCQQPRDGAQGVSGAVGGCSRPALLSWVDWAVAAMPVLSLGWLGCSIRGVVLNPRPTRGWQDVPCPPLGPLVTRCWHRQGCWAGMLPNPEGTAGGADGQGRGTGAAWPVAVVPGSSTLPFNVRYSCIRKSRSRYFCSTLHCCCCCSWTRSWRLLPLQMSRSRCSACSEASTCADSSSCCCMSWYAWGSPCRGSCTDACVWPWNTARAAPVWLTAVANPSCSSCQALGLDDSAASPGFGQRAAMEGVPNWWVQTSTPPPPGKLHHAVCVPTVPPGSGAAKPRTLPAAGTASVSCGCCGTWWQ